MAFIITLECSKCGIEYGKIRFSRENKNKLAAEAQADGWRVWHGDFVFCPKCQALIESEKRPVGRPPKAKGPKRPVGRPRTREINDADQNGS